MTIHLPTARMVSLPAALAVTFLSACTVTQNSGPAGTPTATYAGPLLPQNQTALLYCDRNVLVKSIDGNPNYQRQVNALCNFSLRPGAHLLALSDVRGGVQFTLPINVEEGQVYTLRAVYAGNQLSSAVLKRLPAGTAYNSPEALNPQP